MFHFPAQSDSSFLLVVERPDAKAFILSFTQILNWIYRNQAVLQAVWCRNQAVLQAVWCRKGPRIVKKLLKRLSIKHYWKRRLEKLNIGKGVLFLTQRMQLQQVHLVLLLNCIFVYNIELTGLSSSLSSGYYPCPLMSPEEHNELMGRTEVRLMGTRVPPII